jgi:hypothetical protein
MRSFLEKKVHSGISCFSMPRQPSSSRAKRARSAKAREPAAISIDSGEAAQTLEKLIARGNA